MKGKGLPWLLRTPKRKQGLTFREMQNLLVVASGEEVPRIGLAVMVNAGTLLARRIYVGSPIGKGKYWSSHRVSLNRRKLARVPDSTSYPTPPDPQAVLRVMELSDSLFITNDATHGGARGNIGYAPFLEMPRHASRQAPRGIYGPAVKWLGRRRDDIFRAAYEGRRMVA